MSSSSLTALTSSDPPPSHRTLPAVEATRPVARRTYGRRREVSPVGDQDGPTLGALFTSSDPAPPSASKTYLPRDSPSKALLNRFASSATGWMTSLGELGAEAEDADRDGGDDEEVLKMEMARLRQEARGGKTSAPSSRSVDLPAPTAQIAPRKVPTKNLQATSSISTLTTLPTSPLRSSPPQRFSDPITSVVSAPVAPVGRPNLAAMFDESSDEEARRSPTKPRSTSPASNRSNTPTPAIGSGARSLTLSPTSPARLPATGPSKLKTSRLQAFMADLEDSADGNAAQKPGASRLSLAQDNFDEFLATLRQDDEEDEDDQGSKEEERLVKQTSSLSVALFDDEEDSGPSGRDKKGKRVKSLAKKEMAQMHKDVAAAKRDRQYHPFKPEVDHLPISSWAQNAYNSILKASEAPPTLVQDHGSPASSPFQVTPDEITAFTPSSAVKNDAEPLHRQPLPIIPGTSSPTPIVLGQQGKQKANHEDDDDELSLDAMLERDLAKLDKRDDIEDRRKVLQRRKEAALRQSKWLGKPEKGQDSSDEELSVLPKKEQIVQFEDVKPAISHRTAKSVLANYKHSNGMTKSRQAVLPMTRQKSDVTETLAAFAGKTFKHANLRAANGGARPAGQKRNREVPVTQRLLIAYMAEQHGKQSRAVREKKEEIFKVKQKRLPPKEVRRLDDQLEALVAREAAGPVWDDGEDGDEDEDDEDFELSGSEDEGDGEDDDAEVLQYSGDEDGEEGNAIAPGELSQPDAEQEERGTPDDVERIVVDDHDKENERPLATSQAERLSESAKAATPTPRRPLETDESTPRSTRNPLAEIQTSPSKVSADGVTNTFVDVAGFGSGGGSPGFSQLFEATQAAGPSSHADAFAGLRDRHEALLPAHALLPQVEITKTQIERDNALIAGDGDGDLDADAMDQRPKTQYLNEQGFFTQTKPLQLTRNTSEISANLLAGSSLVLEEKQPEDYPGYDLSSTQRGTSEAEIGGADDESIPRSEALAEHESLAATEADLDMEQDEDDKEEDSVAVPDAQPVDAFARLMSAGQRPLSKHQKRAKALIRSNLVDEQAEESEEDDWLMPGQKSDDEEDNDGEEDAYLADLVNDEAVNEEEKRKQDALVAAKVREVQMADDAKREAEARKITEGEYRHKRRGKDFYSDDEDGSPRKKRWSKKERRARKAWKEDGLEKLDGETNVFHTFYDNDLDSDVESVEEMPSPRKQTTPSPKRTHEEKMEMLRRVARMNKEGRTEYEEDDLDYGLLGRSLSRHDGDDTDQEVEEEPQYSISRAKRTNLTEIVKKSYADRSESFNAFVKDAQTERRSMGAAQGASVVRPSASDHSGRSQFGNRPQSSKSSRALGGSSSSGGSILMSKTSKFA